MATKPEPAAATRIADIVRLADMDPAAATKLAAKARAEGVRAPLVHYLLGLELKSSGAFEEAIVELGQGLKLAPKDVRLMNAVGFCLIELGRRQAAAQVFGAALAADPTSAEASYGYGWAAERLGALASAESAFQRTVQLDPKHANALAGLSGLAARRREWARARALASEAMRIDPGQTDALVNLVRIDLGEGAFDAAEARLASVIALPNLRPQARANARILLGDALDGRGRFEEAYASYAQGKSELATLHARPGMRFAVDAARALHAEFLETLPENWSEKGPTTPVRGERGHVFLTGFPRSGTTLLEQVLATHPDIAVLGERPLLLKAESEFLTQPGGVKRLANVVGGLLAPFREDYWRRAAEFGIEPAGKVFIEKHPLANVRLPLIHKLFPAAKIIFAMRDPRDVVLSCFRRSFNMNPAMYEFNWLTRAASYYDAVMTATETYFERLDVSVFRLKYEDVVADFDTSVVELCDFLKVPWTDDLRNFAETAKKRFVATPSGVQVARGLYTQGVGQWRNYAFAFQDVLPILAPWIEKFDYPAT